MAVRGAGIAHHWRDIMGERITVPRPVRPLVGEKSDGRPRAAQQQEPSLARTISKRVNNVMTDTGYLISFWRVLRHHCTLVYLKHLACILATSICKLESTVTTRDT